MVAVAELVVVAQADACAMDIVVIWVVVGKEAQADACAMVLIV